MRAGMRRGFLLIIGALLTLPWDDAFAGLPLCAGDCDGSGAVTIDELVIGVGIAQSAGPVDACTVLDLDGGGSVTIDELVAAVASALGGCPPEPATPTTVIRRYAQNLYANYSDSLFGAEQLRAAIDAFLDAPSDAGPDRMPSSRVSRRAAANASASLTRTHRSTTLGS